MFIDSSQAPQACFWARRSIGRVLSAVILGLAFLPELLCAAPPIQFYKWGSFAYSVPHEFDSFDAVVADRMPIVVITRSPFAYPKYAAHPGQNCDNNDAITELTDPTDGRICSEDKVSFACSIPGLNPPYYASYCQGADAILSCPTGYAWSGTQCVLDGNYDPEKECSSCSRAGNPIQIGLGTKFQAELDYSAPTFSGLRWERTYSSTGRARWAGLGELWRHTYARSITVVSGQGTQMAIVRRADGTVYQFVLSAGVWGSEADVDDRLSEILDGGGIRMGWSYISKANDETETYDANGKLLSIADRSGLSVTVSYDTAGRMQRVGDAFGRHLAFGYDGVGRIISMTDPAGSLYQYAYDSSNRLVSVTYPDATPANPDDNPKRLYHYENTTYQVALTGITDENGNRFATFSYDAQGRAIETKHLLAGGVAVERYSVSYPSSSSATVTDPLGTARAYTFQTINRARKQTSISQPCTACAGLSDAALSYDANGNIAARTDFNGNQTTYTYDLTRNLETRRVEGLTASGSSTAVTRTISTEWDASFRLPHRLAEPKRITTFSYDSNGNLSSKSIQATTDANCAAGFSASSTGAARTWSYTNTYSSSIPGQLVQQVVNGPRTDVTDTSTYLWDASGNLSSITNALGHVTTLSNYDAHGRPRQIIDPNGLVTLLSYDVRGRLTSRNVGGELTSYTYDAVGQLTQVTLPDGSFLAYTYDAAHRLTQIQDNLNNKITYTLDAMGNRTQEQVTDPGNALAQTRSRVYNGLNRLVQDIGANPVTEITNYAYDNQGNRTSITDPLNHTTTQAFDALNRLVRMTDPNSGQTQYGYDGLDQLTAVTDPRTLTTSYAVDGLGNLNQQGSPDTGTTANAYDAAGNLTSSLDAAGVQALYSYDALNRVIAASYTAPPNSGIANTSIIYSYDQGANGIGRLTGVSDATGTTSYAYDQKGRLTQQTRVIAGQSYTTGYSYDSLGRLTGVTYPGGRQVNYTLDALGRVNQIATSVNGQAQTVVFGAAYRPFGTVASFAFGNGQLYARSFDLDGRIYGYTQGNQSVTLTYDAAGRISTLTNAANPGAPSTFGYDSLDRVNGYAQGTTTWSYQYDANGNRTNLGIGGNSYPYTISAANNQLTSVAGPTQTTYTYDGVGNLKESNLASFSYDARHRLIGSVLGSSSVAYQVNALGQRVQKLPSLGSATVFHYDKDGKLIAESDPAGNIKTSYVYLNDLPVALIAPPPGSACNVSTPQPDPGTTRRRGCITTTIAITTHRRVDTSRAIRLGCKAGLIHMHM